MSKRIQDLRRRYPYMFERVIPYGLNIEPGWLSIIEGVCRQIDTALETAQVRKANFSWIQIKEKFGTLRMAWDRAWNVPEGPLPSSCNDEPEFIFPEAIPEDPGFDESKQTLDEYLASPRAAEWDAAHMIPNPALANMRRDPTRYFEPLMSLEFEQGVSDDDMDFITETIAQAVMVPEQVTNRIRSIIEAAEVKASKTCQFCGAPGVLKHLDNGGWMVTACEMHGTREAIVELRNQEEGKRDA